MRPTILLPLAAIATAFVIPDEQTASELVLEADLPRKSLLDKVPTKESIFEEVDAVFASITHTSQGIFDDLVAATAGIGGRAKDWFCSKSLTGFHTQAWLDGNIEADAFDLYGGGEHPPPPHRGPPHRRPHHGPHHGHHGHHGHKCNATIYDLINKSKYTKILAKIVNADKELVEILNGTKANYTLFAPIDAAFKKLPHHNYSDVPKELIRNAVLYHLSPEFYPAGRVLISHTAPSAFKEPALGDEPQRLAFRIGLRGLTINFISRIIAIDIFASNGVIHGIDFPLFPPPPGLKIIELLPGEFSTLQLGLYKTGLFDEIKESTHIGGTLFAPTNDAFKLLGPRANAFLFSSYGLKYLKALLEYHIVANQTLYSDAFYKSDSVEEKVDVPKGFFHVDLPTLLEDKALSIDIARWAGFIQIKINGYTTVSVQDGIAKDGVIHGLFNVLIPPKTLNGQTVHWQGEELDEEDLKERLAPFLDNGKKEL